MVPKILLQAKYLVKNLSLSEMPKNTNKQLNINEKDNVRHEWKSHQGIKILKNKQIKY